MRLKWKTMAFETLSDLAALYVLAVWPVVLIGLIVVHSGIRFWRRLASQNKYLLLAVLGAFYVASYAAFFNLVFANRDTLLAVKLPTHPLLPAVGVAAFAAGILIHLKTGSQMGWLRLFFVPELFLESKQKLVTTGLFSVVRHPTYWSHSLLVLGVFLSTRVAALGWLWLLDLVVTQLVVIPLEERELRERFGKAYEDYAKRVPRSIPMIA